MRDRRSRPIDARRFRTFDTQVAGGNGQNAPTRRRSFGFASRHSFDLQAMQVEYPLQLVDRELPTGQELEAGARCNAMHEPRSAAHSVQVEVNPFRRSHGRSTDRTHKGHGLPLARDLAGVLERPPDLEVAVSRSATKSCHVRRRNQDKPHLSQAENPTGGAPACSRSAATSTHLARRRASPEERGRATPCSLGEHVPGKRGNEHRGTARVVALFADHGRQIGRHQSGIASIWHADNTDQEHLRPSPIPCGPTTPPNTPRWNLRENRPSHRVGFRFRRPPASKIIRCLSALEWNLWAERAASFSY